MERFKACEKEMKTKAYSKEGLINSTKLDPRDKEKVESSNWVSNFLEELEHQVEALEAEQETIQGTMKKGRKDAAKQERISEIEEFLERDRWHIEKLEIILRMLENGTISPDSVNTIQDDIQYYVESNQDADFAEDDEIYNELNLDEEDAEENYVPKEEVSYSLDDLAAEKDGAYNDNNSHATQIAASIHNNVSSSKHDTTSPPSTSAAQKASTHAPAVAVSSHHQPATPITSSILGAMKPAPPPARSINELKYASAAASGSNTNVHHGLAPLPPPSASVQKSSESSPSQTPGIPVVAVPVPKVEPKPAASVASSPEPVSESIASDKINDALPEESASKATPPPQSSSAKHSMLPPGLQSLIGSFEAAKNRIGAPPPISSISKLLESSYLNCPDSFMAKKPKYYQPENYFPVPSYYPQEPLTTVNNAAIFQKMDIDTLFYIFYYRQGTYQQSLAAKELKSRSWRFHKRFLTWFQRYEEPKDINNDYEQGTYRYFDFEGLWLQRRKSNFKFEYLYLEDDI